MLKDIIAGALIFTAGAAVAAGGLGVSAEALSSHYRVKSMEYRLKSLASKNNLEVLNSAKEYRIKAEKLEYVARLNPGRYIQPGYDKILSFVSGQFD
jgi:hypothetical protein